MKGRNTRKQNPSSGPALQKAGLHPIFDLGQSKQPFAEQVVVARRDWVAKNRDTMQRYIDASIEGLQRHGHKHVLAIDGAEDLAPLVASLAKPGGAIVCLGAGSITGWAAGLEAALKSREAKA